MAGTPIPLSRLAPDLALSAFNALDGQVRFTESDRVADGAFGVVYKATWTPPRGTPLTVAVKTLKLTRGADSQQAFSEFRHETSLMAYVIWVKKECQVDLS